MRGALNNAFISCLKRRGNHQTHFSRNQYRDLGSVKHIFRRV